MTRKQASPYKTIARSLGTLTTAELHDLAALLQGLIETREDEAAANAPKAPMPATGSSRTTKKVGRGSIELKVVGGCGPYKYLRYWQNGVHKSEYIGKA